MYLSRLEIENFRGVRSARIEFNESTVLIGENDSGKTTLLEAIFLVLAPRPEDRPVIFEFDDFHRVSGFKSTETAGNIRIKLTFRERYNDEWSFMRKNELGLELPDDVNQLQELTLDIMASPAKAGENSAAMWRIVVEHRKNIEFSRDLNQLAWFRRLNPVFRTKTGILENLPEATEDIQARYMEAIKSLGKDSDLFFQEGPLLEQVIYEILGRKPQSSGQHGKVVNLRHGSAAEKIGMLLFITAFLQSGSLMVDPSAEPIIIIEDPEAHLHPMTLQAYKLMIERLKWQKIITTQSGGLLSDFSIHDIRRITRHEGNISQYLVRPGSLSSEELRRLSYHVRMRLSTATFARCWLLVEGESEIWFLPHLARLCGYDLALEGVVCVEFAQCGIAPLIKAARQFGIQWFLLADGDAAGKSYIDTARNFAREAGEDVYDHSLRLPDRDIEHHMYFNGYESIYREYAKFTPYPGQKVQARNVIGRAIHRNSKPFMAVAVVEAISRADSAGVPPLLRKLIESCVKLAKVSEV
jgi:putative ATP-dependent endonuclease of the OLD family